MKEIVIIPKEHIEYEQISGAGFDTIRFHLGTDKTLEVPENWEELKCLCKKLKLFVSKNINMEKDNEYIVCCWMNFYEYGDILDSDGYAISENRTPQQMWNIIKNLVGEE